mmetsp:Transcript_40450/g.127341  ORF Transcript_40450/g.127341 Transcript_40450/m.127341 type:complete len:267 (-) Transcript_40450:1789-2589(-)
MLLLLLLLLALLGAPCARTQVTGAEELQRVMEQYDYSPALPSSPRTLETCKDSDASCCIELLYPRRGYQGDNSSAARMRRSEARLHFRVRGGGCVQEGGSSLRSRRQLRVLVDEADEAVSTDPELVMAVSETLSGSHHVTAMVEEEEEEGRRFVAKHYDIKDVQEMAREMSTEESVKMIEGLEPRSELVYSPGSDVVFVRREGDKDEFEVNVAYEECTSTSKEGRTKTEIKGVLSEESWLVKARIEDADGNLIARNELQLVRTERE